MPHNASLVFFNNQNQGCVAGQTQESNGPAWNVGSYVWTLFDYYGEPGHWCGTGVGEGVERLLGCHWMRPLQCSLTSTGLTCLRRSDLLTLPVNYNQAALLPLPPA